jgi:formylmethanofuran dehydrogenase subunit E
MRHKTITLCPTTYEIARKMDNFSAWIRQELMKKQATEYKAKPELIQERQKYGAYCDSCDVTFLDTDSTLLKGRMPCKKCGKGTTYLGLIE